MPEEENKDISLLLLTSVVPGPRCGSSEPWYVLVRQYRPPVRSYVIEFPAGLLDGSPVGDDGKVEGIEKCALRELREETGYVGQLEPLPGLDGSNPSRCPDPFSVFTSHEFGVSSLRIRH